VGHKKSFVSGVIRTPGALFTSSFDGTIKILEPTRQPSLITELRPHDGEVTRVTNLLLLLFFLNTPGSKDSRNKKTKMAKIKMSDG